VEIGELAAESLDVQTAASQKMQAAMASQKQKPGFVSHNQKNSSSKISPTANQGHRTMLAKTKAGA